MNRIQASVKHFILRNFLPGEDPGNLTEQMELRESGILDSLSTLKLVFFLEENFRIEFEPDDLEAVNLSTIANIERMVQSKLAARI